MSKRPTVLLAWELGSGRAHGLRLAALARALGARGIDCVLVCRDLLAAHRLAPELDCLPAPQLAAARPLQPSGFNEMLLAQGLGDERGLAALCSAWRRLFKVLGAELLICEFAPFALLAAQGTGLPVLTLATPFHVPLPADRMPSEWTADPARERLAAERVLTAINAQLLLQQAGALSEPAALWTQGSRVLMASVAALDPCGPRPDVDYVGPIGGEPERPPIAEGTAVYAYLKPFTALSGLTRRWATGEETVEVVCDCLDPSWFEGLERVRAHRSGRSLASPPVSLKLAVTHGGHTASTQLLLAGIPILGLPLSREQLLFCRRLQELGLGILADRDRPSDVADAYARLLVDPDFGERARAFAAVARTGGDGCSRVAHMVGELLGIA